MADPDRVDRIESVNRIFRHHVGGARRHPEARDMGPAVRLENRIMRILLAEAVQIDPVTARFGNASGGEAVQRDGRPVHHDVVVS